MKKLPKILIAALLTIMILLTVSCEHNVYFPASDTWGVQGYVFATFSQAINFLMERLGISRDISRDVESDIPWNRTIYLLRDVGEDERGEAIYVPPQYTGALCINFNGHEYWFDPSLDQFLDIQGGDRVDIINGTTVITEDTASRTAALYVDVRVVTVDEHLIDDRRKDPPAVDVGANGTLVITSSSGNRDDLMIGGTFHIAEGGQLQISEGFVYIQDINDINATVPGSFEVDGGKIKCPHEVELIADAAIPEEKRENVDMDVVHDFVLEWEQVLKEPTCHEEGLKKLHYECTHCTATEDVEEVIPKLEHHEVWANDILYHWKECSLCHDKLGNKETHTFVTIGSTTYCTVCGYVYEEGGGAESGFDVTAEDLIPAGYITHTFNELTQMHEFALVSTNENSVPDHYVWYLDDKTQSGFTGTTYTTEMKYESFTVMCIFWNKKGTGSASITIQ